MEDFSTILLGETGTGKGNAAAAIGRSGFIAYDAGRRRFAESFTEAFVPINLSQFPESLIESELFGHRRGAFTGALENYRGAFSRCTRHGSIFLDEIGEVSVPIQIKLLRVLQERAYNPVGSHAPERFEGRVIAATHRPLDELRQDGRFRDDFYYRLCSDVVEVPPLRLRLSEDARELGVLLEVVVERIAGAPEPRWVQEIEQTIGRHLGADYAWPGNVRELEQCARRVMLGYGYTGDHMPTSDARARLRRAIEAGDLSARELVAEYCALLHDRLGTYEAVARQTGLDRRTVKKHIDG
jgi:transcriptional regulator with GAF, ATPase, and Fis domain